MLVVHVYTFLVLASRGKRAAARALLACFQQAYGAVMTIGIGDGPNDASLLGFTDVAFIVRSPWAALVELLVPRARTTKRSGAAGWNEAVLGWLGAGPEHVRQSRGVRRAGCSKNALCT